MEPKTNLSVPPNSLATFLPLSFVPYSQSTCNGLMSYLMPCSNQTYDYMDVTCEIEGNVEKFCTVPQKSLIVRKQLSGRTILLVTILMHLAMLMAGGSSIQYGG